MPEGGNGVAPGLFTGIHEMQALTANRAEIFAAARTSGTILRAPCGSAGDTGHTGWRMLIVNADDLGRLKTATDAALSCYAQKRITSTSVDGVHGGF